MTTYLPHTTHRLPTYLLPTYLPVIHLPVPFLPFPIIFTTTTCTRSCSWGSGVLLLFLFLFALLLALCTFGTLRCVFCRLGLGSSTQTAGKRTQQMFGKFNQSISFLCSACLLCPARLCLQACLVLISVVSVGVYGCMLLRLLWINWRGGNRTHVHHSYLA